MAATYEPIASQTLGSDTSSVDFTSIPTTYTDLRLVLSVKQSVLSSTYVRVNGLTTSIYSVTSLEGNGSSASSRRFNTAGLAGNGIWAAQLGVSDVDYSPVVYDFLSYANTSVFKTVLVAYGANSSTTSTPIVARSVNLVQTTAAITSMNIRPFSGNWKSGSTFSLYGIKAA